MALLPILNLATIAADASSITVVDATGDYSSTNTGGFGTPNPAEVDISGIILSLYSIASINTKVAYRLTSTVSILDTGETLTAVRFPGITTGTIYSDGVYGLKYGVLFNSTDALTWDVSSKEFSLTNANDIFRTAVGFVLPTNTSKIYYIDKTKTLNSAGGFVTEALPATGTTPASFEIVHEGDLKLLVDKAGDKCLTEDIGIWAQLGCEDDNFKDIWTRFKQRIALKSKFTQGYLYDAHKLAIKLASYCDCVTPNSTCNC